jgi:hypothetical protein
MVNRGIGGADFAVGSGKMRIIKLDASGWKTAREFGEALKDALGSCEGHGNSPAAFVDSMIWGGMNSVGPPYVIRVVKTSNAPQEVTDYIRLMISVIQEAREWRLVNQGTDIEVTLVASEISN